MLGFASFWAILGNVVSQVWPKCVEMMGLIGMGNNPMVGATVAVAVEISMALNK